MKKNSLKHETAKSIDPIAPSQRIVSIDVLRGFALLGILVGSEAVFEGPDLVPVGAAPIPRLQDSLESYELLRPGLRPARVGCVAQRRAAGQSEVSHRFSPSSVARARRFEIRAYRYSSRPISMRRSRKPRMSCDLSSAATSRTSPARTTASPSTPRRATTSCCGA